MSGEQQTVVITGASSGFGKATAQAFQDEGWRTFATLRDPEGRNSAPAAELRALGATVVELDVTSDESVERAAATIQAAGAVDVLVNNAGTAFFGLTEAFTPQVAEQQFATNVFGPLRVNRAFLGAMRQRRKGLVVYVSSVIGRFVIPFTGVYAASKWALEALAETTSFELRPFGVDVAIVQPGAFETNIGNSMRSADDEARVATYGDFGKVGLTVVNGLTESGKGNPLSAVSLAILDLAKAPAGSRPLRTVVDGGRTAAGEINARIAPLQREVLTNFGLGELLAPETVTV